MEEGFDPTQLVDASGPTELILVRPGEFIFREGDEAQALYIVKKGSLRIMSGSIVYETVTTGGILGEMALIDQGAPRSASVLAVSTYRAGDGSHPRGVLKARRGDLRSTVTRTVG